MSTEQPAERISAEIDGLIQKADRNGFVWTEVNVIALRGIRDKMRELRRELKAVEADKNTALLHLAQALAERHSIRTERDAVEVELSNRVMEHGKDLSKLSRLSARNGALLIERDCANKERDTARTERDAALERVECEVATKNGMEITYLATVKGWQELHDNAIIRNRELKLDRDAAIAARKQTDEELKAVDSINRSYEEQSAKDAVSALLKLSGHGFPTPVNGYGENCTWAIGDMSQALDKTRTERDAAIAERDALRAAVNLLRKDLERGFGGMHPTSALWSNHPYGKGHNNALSTAITKFDFHLKKLLEAQSNGTK